MMRFDLDEDQRLAREVTRDFLAAEAPPSRARANLEQAAAFDPVYWKKVAALGWTAPLVPADMGGAAVSDNPLVDVGIIAAEIGRVVAPGPFMETTLAISSLNRSTNDTLRSRYLPALLDGSIVAGAILSPDAVAQTGDSFVAGGDFIAALPTADAVLLVSGPTATYLLEPSAVGVSATTLRWLDPSIRHARVHFEHAHLPDEARLASGPAEFEELRRTAWVVQAAELSGVIDAAFARTLDWLAHRYSFGRPLASYQALKHRCADMKMWQEATHAVADAAVDAVASGAPDAGLVARAAKAYAATHALELIQDCIQLHGGMGVTWEHDLHLLLRRATVIAHSYGAVADLYDEIADLEFAAVSA
jgi:alkylation response protein AidB-like acyl-CoA dehydrogenase